MSRRNINNRPKLNIKKGDNVRVLSGAERGKEGRVLQVLSRKHPHREEWVSRVIVEGINLVTKHVKPDQKNPKGAKNQTEAGVHISNVMLLEPKSGKPTRVGRTKTENGWVRVAKRTNDIIK